MSLPTTSPLSRPGLLRRSNVTAQLQFEIEQFLYAEAALLDERAYAEWFDLVADDVRYLMPIRVNQNAVGGADYLDPKEGALFDESKKELSLRINRLVVAGQTGLVPAENPAPIYRRFVTNVRVKSRDGDEELDVSSLVAIYKTRLATQVEVLVAARSDVLRRAENPLGWSIAARTAYFDVATIPTNSLNTIF